MKLNSAVWCPASNSTVQSVVRENCFTYCQHLMPTWSSFYHFGLPAPTRKPRITFYLRGFRNTLSTLADLSTCEMSLDNTTGIYIRAPKYQMFNSKLYNFQVVLCFSPVGATLRIRARKFPSLVNCTAINWFHEWPQEALRSVSKRFIAEVESLPVIIRFLNPLNPTSTDCPLTLL